jgi:hypothetical protein
VGSGPGTPVNHRDRKVVFRSTGKLTRLTVKLGPPQLSAKEKKALQKKIGERDELRET